VPAAPAHSGQLLEAMAAQLRRPRSPPPISPVQLQAALCQIGLAPVAGQRRSGGAPSWSPGPPWPRSLRPVPQGQDRRARRVASIQGHQARAATEQGRSACVEAGSSGWFMLLPRLLQFTGHLFKWRSAASGSSRRPRGSAAEGSGEIGEASSTAGAAAWRPWQPPWRPRHGSRIQPASAQPER